MPQTGATRETSRACALRAARHTPSRPVSNGSVASRWRAVRRGHQRRRPDHHDLPQGRHRRSRPRRPGESQGRLIPSPEARDGVVRRSEPRRGPPPCCDQVAWRTRPSHLLQSTTTRCSRRLASPAAHGRNPRPPTANTTATGCTVTVNSFFGSISASNSASLCRRWRIRPVCSRRML